MSDKVAEAREWLETPSAMPHYEDVERELIIAVQLIRGLLEEIDRLQERTYLALRQDTDRQIIADSRQYERGYNDAIDAAVWQVDNLIVGLRAEGAPILRFPTLRRRIAALRRGDSNANTDES